MGKTVCKGFFLCTPSKNFNTRICSVYWWFLWPYRLVWATELSLAAIGLVFPALVLGYKSLNCSMYQVPVPTLIVNLYDYILNCYVVGRLYSTQYKSIFGAPDKVRRNTCNKARPLSQVWGFEPNTSSGYEVAEPPHHHQIIVGMQDCIPTYVFGTGQTKQVRSNGHLHGPLFPRPG